MSYKLKYHDGEPYADNLTLKDAAIEVLNYDGHIFEIKKEDGMFSLYHSEYSVNRCGGSGKMAYVFITCVNEDEIYQSVINRSEDFGLIVNHSEES